MSFAGYYATILCMDHYQMTEKEEHYTTIVTDLEVLGVIVVNIMRLSTTASWLKY